MAVFTDIHIDWENEEIVLQNIDEAGAAITTSPNITLKLQDLEFAVEIIAKMRRAHYTDANTGDAKRCYLLATKPEDDSTDDGHSDADEDLHIGGGGGSYKGEYDAATAYKVGDIVRKRTGTSQGVYVCVVAATGTDPVYPEPADTGGTNTWEILALGIQQIDVCLGGTDTQLPVNIGT